jgi:hypothetical protein
VDWARRLQRRSAYDPEVEQILTVTQVLDTIYEHAGQ